jgi:carbon-monoxide dehydrogenase medium subunit
MIRPFEYHRPRTPREVGELLLAHPGAAILAGGTDLLVDMRAGVSRPEHVIDVKRVDGLDECRAATETEAGFIGARVTLNRIAEDDRQPALLRDAARSVATYQVRNRATLVGNLCHASPAADTAPPLLVLGASARVRTADGADRAVPLAQFFAGVKRTVLRPGEWVVGIDVPPQPASLRGMFLKRQRVKGHDLAVVNAAGCSRPDAETLRVAVGACAPTPLLFELDDLRPARGAAGTGGIDALCAAAWARIGPALRPISDNRAGAEYRTDMARLLVTTILRGICGPAGDA